MFVVVGCSQQPPILLDGGDGGPADAGPDGGPDSGFDAGFDAGLDGGLLVPDAGPHFGTPLITTVEDGVAELAAADFNGDGKQDLVVSLGSPDVDGRLVVFLAGKGDGTFEAPVHLWVGAPPRGVAALDIDGDGRQDLAVGVCADGGNWVSFFLSVDGGFGDRRDVPVAACPFALSVADLNGDGRPDLVTAAPGPYVTSDGGMVGEVDILLSVDGGLSLATSLSTPAPAIGVTATDLNGDGFADLAATTTFFDGGRDNIDAELLVWLAVDGGSSWRSLASIGLDNGGYRQVAAGDVDRDGLQDLALVSAHSSTVAVLLGKGDGTFQTPAYLGVSGNPVALGFADFRGDGWLDVALAVPGIWPFLGMSVLPGGASGPMPLNPEMRILSDGPSEGLAIADFNGDGLPDVALSISDISCVAVIPALSGPPLLPDPTTYHPAQHAPVGPLAYNGGPIIATPHMITINYQDDPNTSVYEGYDEWIVTSQWLDQIGADYGVGFGTNENVVLAENAPTRMQDLDVRNLIYGLILDGGLPPPVVPDGGGLPQEIYFLYLPYGTTLSDSSLGTSCQSFGGYHAENDLGPVPFAYAVIPTCDPSSPAYQELAISHELAEAASDPLVATAPAYTNGYDTGWLGEIGDLCTSYDTGYQMPDGGPYYYAQRIWSMSAADAGTQPCIPSPRTLYANVSPDAGPDIQASYESLFVANAGDTLTFTLTGWASQPSVPFAIIAGPWGVGLVPASYGLPVSIDKSNLSNGEEATMTVTVPATAGHHSLGIATILAGFDDDNYSYWPIAVYVP